MPLGLSTRAIPRSAAGTSKTSRAPGIAGTDVEMVQETDYPWSGDVAITVNPETTKTFTIRIRVPNREVSALYNNTPKADGISWLKVNGKLIQPPVEKGYAVIHRTWEAGDRIHLAIPMTVQRVKGIDKIEATRGQVALRYGPLMYCAESVDQNLDDVLSPDAPLRTEWKPDLLDGVLVIKGKWADGSALLTIPYYARSNRDLESSEGVDGRDRRRGGAHSTVWLKDE